MSLSWGCSDAPLLSQFVQVAHNHGVVAHVAIGGWTGSRVFSSNVASAQNCTTFVQTAADLAMRHRINFDWQYPNNQAMGCNAINANNTANFLSFLQELRADPVGAKLTLSTATPVTPFHDASGNPSADLGDFARVLDYVAIMDYDVWDSSSPYIRPNAPLDDALRCGSLVVLGVAYYGHSFTISPSDGFTHDSNTELAAYPRYNTSNQPLGDSWATLKVSILVVSMKDPVVYVISEDLSEVVS
ncbi:Glycoside hydrolase superfamily [Tylopilus felleus]